ncbi:MAG: hypothetical protein KKD39_02805, partial [Candidatus Altiarchaeota archaeon]|nr:hypothetical protein [Candidatus Altiarchaeota archaeon]
MMNKFFLILFLFVFMALFNIQYLFYCVLCTLLFFFLGFGFTAVLLPDLKREYTLFLSPFFGFSYLVASLWFLYNLDIGGTDVYWWWLMLPPFFALFFKPSFLRDFWSGWSCSFYPFLALLIAFFSLSIPLLSIDVLAARVLGNNDVIGYCIFSRTLKEMSPSGLVGFAASQGTYQVMDTVFGAYSGLSFFSSVVGIGPHEVEGVLIVVFLVLQIPLVFVFARDYFKYSEFASFGVSVAFGLNSVVFYTIYQYYLSQVISMGLCLCILLLCFLLFSGFGGFWRLILVFGVLNFGFSLTYPHMLPLVYLVVFFYISLRVLFLRSFSGVYLWFRVLIGGFILSLFFSPYRAVKMFENLFLMGSVKAGWFIPILDPKQIFGVDMFYHLYVSHFDALSFLVVAFVLAGIIKLYKTERDVFLVCAAFFVSLVVGYLYLCVLNDGVSDVAGEGWGGYKHYKFLSFFIAPVLISSLVFFRSVRWGFSYTWDGFSNILFLVYLFLVSSIAYSMVSHIGDHSIYVSEAVSELSRVESLDGVDSINILPSPGGSYWENMWEHYFLLRKNLYTTQDTYFPGVEGFGEWFLLRNMSESSHSFGVVDGRLYVTDNIVSYDFPVSEFIEVNSVYSLVKTDSWILDSFGSGWSAPEENHRWMESNVSVIYVSSERARSVNVTMEQQPLNPDNAL